MPQISTLNEKYAVNLSVQRLDYAGFTFRVFSKLIFSVLQKVPHEVQRTRRHVLPLKSTALLPLIFLCLCSTCGAKDVLKSCMQIRSKRLSEVLHFQNISVSSSKML